MDTNSPLSTNPEPIQLNQNPTAIPLNTSMPNSSAPVMKKPGTSPVVFIVIGIVLVICCCLAICAVFYAVGLNSTKGKINNISSTNNNVTTTINIDQANKPQVAGDFTYTVNSVQQSGDDYIFNMTINNTSSGTKEFSTLLMMTLNKNISDTIGYDQDFLYSIPSDQRLDKSVPANGSISGQIAFKVSDNPAHLNLVLSGGPLSSSKVIVIIK